MSSSINSSMKKTRTLSITSGKGGVGKTTIASNIATGLSLLGHRVLIFDGDLGMANVDIMFNTKSRGHILEVLRGEKEISEIITPIANNIDLISGGSGVVEMSRLDAGSRRGALDMVSNIENMYDFMIIDTAPGISDNVLYLNAAAQISAVVINPDPSSLTDSYALIKVLHQEYKENRFAIICNQVRDEAEGLSLYNRFSDVVNRFLFIGLDYWGCLAQDPMIRKLNHQQRLILKQDPLSLSARQLNQITVRAERSLNLNESKSGLGHFWNQVVGVA
jgi:flagellar biosynthesis protein FlhG